MSQEEILVLPDDVNGSDKSWIQDAIINKSSEKVFYTKTDARKSTTCTAKDVKYVTFCLEASVVRRIN